VRDGKAKPGLAATSLGVNHGEAFGRQPRSQHAHLGRKVHLQEFARGNSVDPLTGSSILIRYHLGPNVLDLFDRHLRLIVDLVGGLDDNPLDALHSLKRAQLVHDVFVIDRARQLRHLREDVVRGGAPEPRLPLVLSAWPRWRGAKSLNLGRFRDRNLLRKLFETVVQRCLAEGLVDGTAFAVDASLITNQVTCITKPHPHSPREHITHVGGVNPQGQYWYYTRDRLPT
jgi:hypothetical protein